MTFTQTVIGVIILTPFVGLMALMELGRSMNKKSIKDFYFPELRDR
jgi:hypothetical protein